jgi:hypothetical protein
MRIEVYADEIRPGDVIKHQGCARRITNVVRHSGWAFPVAVDGTGWAIALDHHIVSVSRN